MDADIVIASNGAVKYKCSTASVPSARLAQVSGQPRMSGPDNSRNYRDFVSKCCAAMREISTSVSLDPQHDVASDIAHRLAENQRILKEASDNHVPPSGRPKKGNNLRKKTTTGKAPETQQESSSQTVADETSGSRPAKMTKTASGQSVSSGATSITGSSAMSGVGSSNSATASAASGPSSPKRKKAAAPRAPKTSTQTPESYYIRNGKRFLESYTFVRVILDEYSFKDHEVETFVEGAIASSKWLLSGTPPLTKLSLVCRTASMLNVHVARIEPALPSHLQEITEGPSAADMSASVAYRALRQLKTTTFAHERHQQGLAFVKQFTRRNPAVLSGDFQVVRKVVFVSRDTPVIAHYCRLQQCLYAARWDVQGLSQDGNDLLKPVVELGVAAVSNGQRRARASNVWIQDSSTDGRLDAAIQALLMHTTLPSGGFHATAAADVAGMTISDSLRLLTEDAWLSCSRLCSTLKSQFDRLEWLVAQFSEMEIKGSAGDEEEGAIEADGGEDEIDEEANLGGEELPDSTEAGTEVKKAKSREARDRKFRQASRYLTGLVHHIENEMEESIGGLEILNLLRATLSAQLGRPRHTNVPGTHFLVDWYPEIDQRLSEMSDNELNMVYRDCADLLEKQLPENFDALELSERRTATTTMIHDAQAHRREQFAQDDVEERSGLTQGGTDDLLTYRMRARKIGLKCLASETLDVLRDRYNNHKRGRCPDKFWEFALGLTSRFPISGMTRHLRGTDVEEGVEDLTWTSQSVTAGAYEKIPEAFHRYRFLLTVSSLARGTLDGRLCDWCGRTGVPCDQICLVVGCDHTFCDNCVAEIDKQADQLSWCPFCRSSGETRTKLQTRPAPGLFCHACRKTKIETPSDAHVLATCGHMMCAPCIDHLYANPPRKVDGSPDLPRCNVQGCNYHLLENEIRGDKLITRTGNVPLASLGPGGKLQKMIEIANAAKANGEKVLVFAPYKEQMNGIKQSLVSAGISVARTDGQDSINSLARFKNGHTDVLLQLLNSPESAGSNLTNANHIIFVGPYFTRDQRLWQMVVDQATGRCVRPMQTKDVQVYHLVAENSLDVDVLEHHLKRRLEPDENGEVDLSAPALSLAENENGKGVGSWRGSGWGSMLQSAELDMLFRKMVDYNDTENLH